MQILLPENLALEPLVAALTSEGVAIGRGPAAEALPLLLRGGADVALVPTFDVLRNAEQVDVMPGVAFSTWDYPFARLVLKGLDKPTGTLAADPALTQEILLASVLLGEHYGFTPQVVPVVHPRVEHLETHDAVLVVGNDAPLLDAAGVVMDLGREWYELVNYPMVWGLFVTRKGEAQPAWRRALLDAVALWETQQALWLRAREMPEVLHSFFSEGIRFRFDDLAVASLTELREYLFERRALDEVTDLPIADLPDEEGDADRDPLL